MVVRQWQAEQWAGGSGRSSPAAAGRDGYGAHPALVRRHASWRPLAELEQASTPVEVVPALDIDAAPAVEGIAPDVGDPSDPYRAPVAAPDRAAAAGLEGEMALYASVVGGNFPIYRQRWRLDQALPRAVAPGIGRPSCSA